MEFHGELVTDKAEAGKLLIAEMRRTAQIREEQHLVDPVEVGKYRGFSAAMSVENFGSTFVLTLQGQMTHRVELGMDVVGNFLRIDHALDKMPERIAALQIQINSIQSQMEVLRNRACRWGTGPRRTPCKRSPSFCAEQFEAAPSAQTG